MPPSFEPAVPAPSHPLLARLDRRFEVSARGSNFSREIFAGLTTFTTMSYILVVHPHILAAAGMDLPGLITVTALAAAIFSILMGLWSNYPIALAPGMGVNVFFAFQVVLAMHIPWPSALGLVFYSGLLFFLLSVSGLRQKILDAFPNELKAAISAGIGLFIAFVGLRNAGIIVADAQGLVTLGNIFQPVPLLGLLGIVLATVLLLRRVPAALIITILTITVVGLFVPAPGGGMITHMPTQVVSWPNPIDKLFLKLDLVYFWTHFSTSFVIVLSILFTDLFTSMIALVAICTRAGLATPEGNLPNMKQALLADATAATGGALLGTSTIIFFIESAAGVEEGGRTGLVSIVVAACFLAALVFSPIILIIPAVATAPVLIMIGVFMLELIAKVDLRNLAVATPTALTLLLMLLGTIQDGLGIGFLSYIAIQVAIGKGRSVPLITYGLGAIFLLHYLLPVFFKTH
jgi:AGZA family xanthine/uracil permease-like MFS transporter